MGDRQRAQFKLKSNSFKTTERGKLEGLNYGIIIVGEKEATTSYPGGGQCSTPTEAKLNPGANVLDEEGILVSLSRPSIPNWLVSIS